MPTPAATPPLAPRSEKGLLTPSNSAVAFVDLQPQMLFGVASHDRQSIINNNLVLAKAARVFAVPAVLSRPGRGSHARPLPPPRTQTP